MNPQEIQPYIRSFRLRSMLRPLSSPRCAADHRLFYSVEGEIPLQVAGEQLVLAKDEYIILPPGTPYQMYLKDGFSLLIVNFDMVYTHPWGASVFPMPPEEFQSEFPADTCPELLLHKGAGNRKQREWLLEIHRLYLEPQGLGRAVGESLFRATLLSMLQKTAYRQTEQIRAVRRYVAENIESPLTNGQLADALSYHSVYLNRIFKEQTGRSLHQYVLEQKLLHAAQLLENTALSVEEVGHRCGFKEISYFIRTFRRLHGKTPHQFRKLQ